MKFHQTRKIIPRSRNVGGKVQWYVQTPSDLISDEEPLKRFFSSRQEADAHAKKLSYIRRSPSDLEWHKLEPSDKALISYILKNNGVPWVMQAIRNLLEKKEESKKTTKDLAAECVESKRQAGIRPNSLASLRCSLDSFSNAMKFKPASVITAKDVETWMLSYDWKPKTKLGRLKDVSSMFAWAQRRGDLTNNPCLGVTLPRVPFKDVAVLSVDDVEKLLAACLKIDAPLLGYVCPILFGGLREAESRRAKPEDFSDGMITLSGDQLKLNERRVVPINETLAAWMKAGAVLGGTNITKRLAAVRTLAGVPWPANCLRHSFCSYALGGGMSFENVARAANNSPAMLNKHYLGVVTRAEAERFWALRP